MITVRADGVYLTLAGLPEIKLPGVAHVTATGGVVLRFPPRDVTVEAPIDVGQHLDCSSFEHVLVAVARSGISLTAVAAIAPAMATQVQTYMQQHGITAQAVD